MKNLIVVKKACQSMSKKVALLTAALSSSLVSLTASAAVPTAASDAVTELITDAGTFVASFWPLAIAVTVGFLWFSLFRKGTAKAT